MKARLSLLVLSIFAVGCFTGCSGISEEEAKKVDLKAKPTNPPVQGGGTGGEKKPGPGMSSKAV